MLQKIIDQHSPPRSPRSRPPAARHNRGLRPACGSPEQRRSMPPVHRIEPRMDTNETRIMAVRGFEPRMDTNETRINVARAVQPEICPSTVLITPKKREATIGTTNGHE